MVRDASYASRLELTVVWIRYILLDGAGLMYVKSQVSIVF